MTRNPTIVAIYSAFNNFEITLQKYGADTIGTPLTALVTSLDSVVESIGTDIWDDDVKDGTDETKTNIDTEIKNCKKDADYIASGQGPVDTLKSLAEQYCTKFDEYENEQEKTKTISPTIKDPPDSENEIPNPEYTAHMNKLTAYERTLEELEKECIRIYNAINEYFSGYDFSTHKGTETPITSTFDFDGTFNSIYESLMNESAQEPKDEDTPAEEDDEDDEDDEDEDDEDNEDAKKQQIIPEEPYGKYDEYFQNYPFTEEEIIAALEGDSSNGWVVESNSAGEWVITKNYKYQLEDGTYREGKVKVAGDYATTGDQKDPGSLKTSYNISEIDDEFKIYSDETGAEVLYYGFSYEKRDEYGNPTGYTMAYAGDSDKDEDLVYDCETKSILYEDNSTSRVVADVSSRVTYKGDKESYVRETVSKTEFKNDGSHEPIGTTNTTVVEYNVDTPHKGKLEITTYDKDGNPTTETRIYDYNDKGEYSVSINGADPVPSHDGSLSGTLTIVTMDKDGNEVTELFNLESDLDMTRLKNKFYALAGDVETNWALCNDGNYCNADEMLTYLRNCYANDTDFVATFDGYGTSGFESSLYFPNN